MRIVIEVVYDLNEDDLLEDDDSDTVVPAVKKGGDKLPWLRRYSAT